MVSTSSRLLQRTVTFKVYLFRKQMHVFEVNKTLPRFATFLQVASVPAEPQGFVEFEFGLKPEHVGGTWHSSMLSRNEVNEA